MDDNSYSNEYNHTESANDRVDPSQSPQRVYAGFWMRFWAYLIDLIIIFSVNGIILSPLLFREDTSVPVLGFITIQGLLSTVVSYVYFLLMTKFFSQTLGKMILGIKVIREDESTLKWADLIFREIIGRFIHRSLVITNVLYLIVGFMEEKQGIHDIFGETRVVHVKK